MTRDIEIFEVGPRDGLQNEPELIATEQKIELIDLLSHAGFRRIEVASFVSPKWVPQMADASEVLAGITRVPGVSYAALTPNAQGFERAVAAQVDEIAIFASASEGFSKANLNATRAQALARFQPVVEAAQAAGIAVRGYVSCVVVCPFDGPVAPARVAETVRELRAMGCYEISLGETLGRALPEEVDRMLSAVLDTAEATQLAGHFHDTGGRALENIEVALDHGLSVFDAAVGGLGGCPYAPGASGNVATEAVFEMLTRSGYSVDLDPVRIAKASALARTLGGRNV
ncbi:MAG: hydroxymethylglutaryl-CoA lyase [Pseudomonadota bacterium]